MQHKSEQNEADKIIVHTYAEIKNLLPDYLADINTNIDLIMAALERRDFPTIESLGHKMSGSGGSYGFDRISDIGALMESAAQTRDKREIQKLVSDLRYYLEHVEVIYE
jgi:HPt (histidine-containing phosphotransfer) domain-containing protein